MYGQPEVRVIADQQWLALPGDLAPGGSAELETRGTVTSVRFALQDIPDV
jgi:hypothetical protein